MKRILVTAMAGVIVSVAAAVSAANAADAPAVEATSPPPAAVKSPLPGTGSTNEPTIITSEQLHGDYAHNVGTFEGNVLAVDPRIILMDEPAAGLNSQETLGRAQLIKRIRDLDITQYMSPKAFCNFDRKFHVSDIVDSIKNPENVNSVFIGFGNKFFDYVIRIVPVSNKILAPE